MESNAISEILAIVLIGMICILFVLILVYVFLVAKSKKGKGKKKEIKAENKKKETKTIAKEYNKQAISNFLEFEKVEDNMIIQKNGKRFLMAIECQGVNYDLMSGIEKNAVEEGFQQFLNTLRHPIQIYIQTRTINLENSVSGYRRNLKKIEDKYNEIFYKYNSMRQSEIYTEKDIAQEFYELTKQRNLLEYATDLITNTEKMSLNKNILNKKYFIIIPYYAEEANGEKYVYEEIKNMAFSELYTKAQSIIRTLSSCSVVGKILNSQELVELLYVAYNRDDSEILGLNKAVSAGYDELYTTAEDVFKKKIKLLDERIRERAIDLANDTVDKIKSETQKKAEEKEENFEDLIRQMAEMILDENRRYVGEAVAEKAIKEIREDKGGEEKDEEGEKPQRRGRKRSIAK